MHKITPHACNNIQIELYKKEVEECLQNTCEKPESSQSLSDNPLNSKPPPRPEIP
jgi:hypothetical protein